jgi:Leucine-rich repeat (LRR) protein
MDIHPHQHDLQWHVIFLFIKRRFVMLISIFVFGMLATAGYVLTQPTLYKTQLDVVVGRILFFGIQQPTESSATEPLEQTIQRITPDFSGLPKNKSLQITAVKKTNILRIVSSDTEEIKSLQLAQNTAQKIILIHSELLAQKKVELMKYLKSVSLENKDTLDLIDAASVANESRIASEAKTIVLPYSGLMIKGFALGFFLSALLAVVLSLIVDVKASRTPANP